MLTIENYDDLLALNRALMEVRYLARDVDSATRGSGFLSSMHSRVIDELVGYHESRGESRKAETWREWRRLAARNIEKASIAAYLASVWPHLKTVEQKREVVVNQARPFTFSDDEISTLIVPIDARTILGAPSLVVIVLACAPVAVTVAVKHLICMSIHRYDSNARLPGVHGRSRSSSLQFRGTSPVARWRAA